MEAPAAGSYPRQQARTRRFSLGNPRDFTISPSGARVLFLRTPAGDDPRSSLWELDTATGEERVLADAASMLGGRAEDLPEQERARRERSRELSGGIVGYACDEAVSHAAFALDGRLWWLTLPEAGTTPGDGPQLVELPAPAGVVDPRPDPRGQWVAFLAGPRLCLVGTEGGPWSTLAAEDAGPGEAAGQVSWGAAEFVAAEEMGRDRGYWWAPDGSLMLAARVDNRAVGTWWTGDPSRPASPPAPHRYPVAGGTDAEVSLWCLSLGGAAHGHRSQVAWDANRYPYLVAVHWSRHGPPLLLVEQRDHKAFAVLAVDLPAADLAGAARGTGQLATTPVVAGADPAWVSWPGGVPSLLPGGELVWAAAEAGTWRLKVGEQFVTPPGLQVRQVTSTNGGVLFTASSVPEVVEAWEWSAGRGLRQLTDAGGVSSAVREGPATVLVLRSMGWDGPRVEVVVEQGGPGGARRARVGSRAEKPVVDPVVRFLHVGPRELSVGVVLPREHAGGPLPVIMAHYGGPGHQQVMANRALWLDAQWFADQGFAVVVADGRGTPGRGPAFEREVHLDLARPPLEDQVEALVRAAEEVPELDLTRVGIRGWSFGGYLAALAVLAEPDVFHAAVAGAPVTDWRLYDTYYTERFLGHPGQSPGAYERSSLLTLAPKLRRPLLIIHGLADDNVYAAHSLELSSALLAAGRPHSLLPLPAITHVASREEVSEALMLIQADFLRRALGGAVPL